jgi:hypothetical protein
MRAADHAEAGARAGPGFGQVGRIVFTAIVHHQRFTGVGLSGQTAGHFVQRARPEVGAFVVSGDDDGKKWSLQEQTLSLKRRQPQS